MRARVALKSGLFILGALCSAAALAQDAQEWRRVDGRDRSSEFVGFVKPERLYWRPFALPGVQAAEFKQLSFDDKTGARTLLVRVPAGWKQAAGYHSADLEMLVLEGGINI